MRVQLDDQLFGPSQAQVLRLQGLSTIAKVSVKFASKPTENWPKEKVEVAQVEAQSVQPRDCSEETTPSNKPH